MRINGRHTKNYRAEKNSKRRCRKFGVPFQPIDHRQVYARDSGRCWVCGAPVDLEVKEREVMSATIDHVIPLSEGGPHTIDNVRLAHMICNSTRNQSRRS